MSRAIVAKDLLLLRRERLIGAVLAALLLLLVVSIATGLQREQVFAKERGAAEVTDKEVWMNQGERNPHGAAHFSRYAFRTSSPLALIDPGTSDYAGVAVWMEAHYQDPAAFRLAEDKGELSRGVQLTPAFLVLAAAPLLIFIALHGVIAGEREDGTLRQLMSVGVGARQFFAGKIGAGLRFTLLGFAAIFVVLALIAALTSPTAFDADALLRLVLLFLTYAAYLTIFVAISIGLSALFRSRQSAFVGLAGVWLTVTVLLPAIAADVGTTIHPQPDARQVAGALSKASNTFYYDQDRRQRIEDDVLKQYGVESVDDLPINYGAYLLQVSEELSVPEFEQVYGDLEARFHAQERVTRWFSFLSPTIAATSLSRGLAATDRIHQHAFTRDAELHRREMVKMLNDDYMLNAGDLGAAYTADAALWAQFEDFDHARRAFGAVAPAYLADFLLLLAWLIGSILFARFATLRAVQQTVPAS